MAAILEAQVRLNRVTNIPADAVVNTFHFSVPGPPVTAEDLTNISVALANFYNTAPAGGSAIKSLMSNIISGTGHRLKIYDLTQPIPRAPILDEAFTMSAPPGTPFPAEVALCLSYRGPLVSGTVAARRRGRLYIGPLSTSTSASESGDARPTLTAKQSLLGVGAALRDNLTVDWGVWSPTALTFVSATNLWVDDAFDVQRRRGAAPVSRLTNP